ncbi:MAG: hypothetical protein ACI83O_000781 [Patescibacteria group bacterium]|jgi:hypothetical protein
MKTTTIRISSDFKKILDNLKIIQRETYEELLFRIIEPKLELSEETLKECQEATKNKKRFSFDEVMECMK